MRGLSLIILGIIIGWNPLAGVFAVETPGLSLQLMDNISADEAVSDAIGVGRASQCRESIVYVDWSTGVTAGVIEVETSVGNAYAGTWASVATVTFAGTAPNQQITRFTGPHWAVRTRVSTAVAGGTVDTHFLCN